MNGSGLESWNVMLGGGGDDNDLREEGSKTAIQPNHIKFISGSALALMGTPPI